MHHSDVDVIIAAHDLARFHHLEAAVESLHAQTHAPRSITVVTDHAPELFERASRDLRATVRENAGTAGASGARNTGARSASGRVLAFLDDDAIADRRWVAALASRLAASDVAGVAGRIRPAWAGPAAPAWFPEEFLWVVGASYRGMPTRGGRVRNAWSNNMGVRRDAFEAVGGFREGFGKLGDVNRPEDTDFCIRINEHVGGMAWVDAPDAVVWHHVGPSRSTAGFFLRRCFNEGRGKAQLRAVSGRSSVSTELDYALRAIPKGFAAGIADAVRGAPAGVARAGAIAAGFAATSAGYGVERLIAR
jgi:glucosyl-dolichyl phosphate glucuronosyltransferase